MQVSHQRPHYHQHCCFPAEGPRFPPCACTPITTSSCPRHHLQATSHLIRTLSCNPKACCWPPRLPSSWVCRPAAPSHAGLAPCPPDSCRGNPSFLSGSCGHPLAPALPSSAPPMMFLTSVSELVEFLPVFFPSSRCTRGSMQLLGQACGAGRRGGNRRVAGFYPLAQDSWFLLPATSLPLCSVKVIHPTNALRSSRTHMPAAAKAPTPLQSVLTQDKKGMVPGVGRRLHGHFASSLESPGLHVADPRGTLSPQTWQRAEGGLQFPRALAEGPPPRTYLLGESP